jgi:hypothetical protein
VAAGLALGIIAHRQRADIRHARDHVRGHDHAAPRRARVRAGGRGGGHVALAGP